MLLSITGKFSDLQEKIALPVLVSALSFNAKSAVVVYITLSNETVVGSIKNPILWLCWVGEGGVGNCLIFQDKSLGWAPWLLQFKSSLSE